MLTPKDFRVWWAGEELGWMIDTEIGLSARVIERLRAYTLEVQQQRLTGMLPGDKRDECLQTIRALESGRITQNIVGKGDHVLFDAYKSTKTMVEV
jgi:hypothetical protein